MLSDSDMCRKKFSKHAGLFAEQMLFLFVWPGVSLPGNFDDYSLEFCKRVCFWVFLGMVRWE